MNGFHTYLEDLKRLFEEKFTLTCSYLAAHAAKSAGAIVAFRKW